MFGDRILQIKYHVYAILDIVIQTEGKIMKKDLNEKEALVVLKKGYGKAEKLLNDRDKLEEFLELLEKKLKTIPKIGDKLAALPIMILLLKSYINKEYTGIPLGSIIAIISALIYVVSPVDLIPDNIPGIGYLDDAAVVAVCWNLVESDVEEYQKWRKMHKKS